MFSLLKKCPEGTLKRKGYTRKNGKTVKSSCVKTRKVCPSGKLVRKAYVRTMSSRVRKEGYTRKTKSGKVITVHPTADSITVKSSCMDAPTRIGPLKKGELKKYGYNYKLPEAKRHSALQRAIHKLGALNVYRKLDAVAKLSERAAPVASHVFMKDKQWVRKTYANKNGILKE